MLQPVRRFFFVDCTEGLAARASADYTDGLAALLPSSSGQDVALSRRKLGFDSPWERHAILRKRRAFSLGRRCKAKFPTLSSHTERMSGRSGCIPPAPCIRSITVLLTGAGARTERAGFPRIEQDATGPRLLVCPELLLRGRARAPLRCRGTVPHARPLTWPRPAPLRKPVRAHAAGAALRQSHPPHGPALQEYPGILSRDCSAHGARENACQLVRIQARIADRLMPTRRAAQCGGSGMHLRIEGDGGAGKSAAPASRCSFFR